MHVPKENRFVSMARLGRFREVSAGEIVPAFERRREIGRVKIPIELRQILSEPSLSDGQIWLVSNIGSVSHQTLDGEFRLMFSTDNGVVFDLYFDSLNKRFIRVSVVYDKLTFNHVSDTDLSVNDMTSIIGMEVDELFRFILQNSTQNKFLTKQIREYLSRWDTK